MVANPIPVKYDNIDPKATFYTQYLEVILHTDHVIYFCMYIPDRLRVNYFMKHEKHQKEFDVPTRVQFYYQGVGAC